MRRDVDLLRHLLLAVEAAEDDESASIRIDHLKYSDVAVSQHIRLLREAGFLHIVEAHRLVSGNSMPLSVSWEGHELLSLIRDSATWEKIKLAAGLTEGDASLALIKSIALREAHKRAGL